MKKGFICLLCFLFLCGCSHNKENVQDNNDKQEKFVLEKINNNYDYVYLDTYYNLKLNGNYYNLDNLIINVNSEDVLNVNLELKSFVTKSYQNMVIDNNEIIEGTIIDYKYYVTDKYISILQLFYPYINGEKGEESVNIYVVSLDNGKVLNNEDILKCFELSEDGLMNKIETNINSEDIMYTMMNIKEEGYDLYVNNDNKLVVSYYEVTDINSSRKDLVL